MVLRDDKQPTGRPQESHAAPKKFPQVPRRTSKELQERTQESQKRAQRLFVGTLYDFALRHVLQLIVASFVASFGWFLCRLTSFCVASAQTVHDMTAANLAVYFADGRSNLIKESHSISKMPKTFASMKSCVCSLRFCELVHVSFKRYTTLGKSRLFPKRDTDIVELLS